MEYDSHAPSGGTTTPSGTPAPASGKVAPFTAAKLPSGKPKKERLLTRDVLLIIGATFLYMGSMMLTNPIMAGFAGSMGVGGVMMGFVTALLSIVALFCRPIAGNLSDRTSKRRLALFGSVLMALANVSYAFAPNTGLLMASRVLNGIGFAACSVCLASWMSMLLPMSRMGAGMGLYGTTNALAQAVGPALGIRCSETIGYRPTFFIAAGMSLAMVACVLLIRDPGLPPSQRRAALEAVEGKGQDSRLRDEEALVDDFTKQPDSPASSGAVPPKRRRFSLNSLFEVKVIPVALIFMLFAIPYFANQSFLVEYCNGRHLDVSASLFFPAYAIALLLLRIFMRNLFDRKSFAFFLTLGTAGDLLMLLGLTVMRSNLVMLAAAIITAFGYGMMSSVTQSQAVIIAGKERAGMANTTYYAGIDLGQAIGPLLGGVLYAALPLQWFYVVFMATMPLAWIIYAFTRASSQRP